MKKNLDQINKSDILVYKEPTGFQPSADKTDSPWITKSLTL